MVELIIACIIIGILISVALPNYTRSVERSKCSQARHILKTMHNAALTYFAENEDFQFGDKAALATEVGANFDDNNDWTFTATPGAETFTVTATRQGGPWGAGATITLDELDQWGGSYPIDDPGGW